MKTILNIITYPAFALFAFACFGLSPTARAQLPSPAPDGGYPNQTTAEGDNALFSLTSGVNNTATGFQALFSNTTGNFNTANGAGALQSNTTGGANTAYGDDALEFNTTGNNNAANGTNALVNNTTGSFNTADGHSALLSNTTGNNNTANGYQALLNNNADNNTGTGFGALSGNTTGSKNTATGSVALDGNTTGGSNTATGVNALEHNTAGSRNTATGNHTLSRNEIGNDNTAEGFQALANNTGSFNVAVGFTAGLNLTTGHDNIDIGAPGVRGESNTMRIGFVKQTNTYIAGISGVTVAGGVGVIIDTSGHLGTISSSARFKQAIKPMDNASEAILALKPVTFRYKKELDPEGIPQFGLIAEQVEKVDPDLVARDTDGKVNTVRYDAVNAMLLNEFLKEHRKVQELEASNVQLKHDFAEQRKQIEALTAGLQKVSTQLELNKPAPQTVRNNR